MSVFTSWVALSPREVFIPLAYSTQRDYMSRCNPNACAPKCWCQEPELASPSLVLVLFGAISFTWMQDAPRQLPGLLVQ